jgi:1,3-propanediol dehydrogenase/alcohol dehydrogenase
MPEMKDYRYLMPTEVFFGPGLVSRVGQEAARLGRNALLVTGKQSAKRSGALDRVIESLKGAGLSVWIFNQVEENPSDKTVARGGELAREEGCDLVVALGGGSPMDAAKGVAILASLGGGLENYYGAGTVTEPVLPVLALPTTAGTGSEVTPYAVFVESEQNTKKSVASPHIFPRVALLDPELTVTMPPDITANTGIDALTHALEGFTSVKTGPVSDLLALEAIAMINEHLPRAVSNGQDLKARGNLLHASMMAGMVIAQTGTTLIHGMGYAPTTSYGIPHGLANGILMDQVVAFNGEEDAQRHARLAEALGQRPDASSGPRLAAEALRGLREKVGMPHRFRDLGVREEDLEVFARQTLLHSRNLANNARSIDFEKTLQIYRKCY